MSSSTPAANTSGRAVLSAIANPEGIAAATNGPHTANIGTEGKESTVGESTYTSATDAEGSDASNNKVNSTQVS